MTFTACEIGRTPRWNPTTSKVDDIVYLTLRKPGGTTKKQSVTDHRGRKHEIGGNQLPDEIVTLKLLLEDYLRILGGTGLPDMGNDGSCTNGISKEIAAKLEAAKL